MWSPTHVQVTVCRVRGLLTKGKNGTNDAFVTISLGKEKFQTSVKQKAVQDVEWQEECELAIPTQGNTAEIVLTALHQNFIGVDEFLGTATLPLSHFDVYERPRTKWYPLKSKPGQESKNKQRGEIEVRVAFTVKSGSLLDLSKKEKHKGSLGHIAQAAHHFGGSLMSLGKEKKGGIKKLASSVGSKLRLPKSGRDDKGEGRLSRHSSGRFSDKFSSGEPDPGVISEDEDEFRFDELSHKSSASSLNLAGGSSLASAQGSLENLGGGELLRRNSMKRSGSSATLPNRALQASSSNLSIASSGGGANKSSSQAQPSTPQQTSGGNDWKLFGSRHSKVSQPEEAPAVSTLNNSSPASKGNESETLVTSSVPSIIIQDSFVIEKPSLSPSSSPSSRSSSSTTPVPRARTSNTKEALKDLDDDFPSVYTPSNRKEHEELVVVVAAPVTVSKGEQAEGDLERKQLATRMPPFFPPPSFPAGEPAPVPKPRRSPAPGLYEEEPVLPPVSVQPVPPPRKFFDNFLDNFIDTSPKNQFESDSGSESDQSDQSERHDVKPEVFERSNVLVLSSLDEESALDEDSVCDLLEKAIEEHDEPKNSGPIPFSSTTIIVNQSVEFKPPSQVSELFNGCEYDKSQQLESEFMIDSPPVGEKKENTVRALNIITSHGSATNSEDEAHEYSDGEPTVDFFNDQTVPISPVEKFEMESGSVLLPIGTPKETPVSKVIRRERLFSLMSTPNSEPDPDQVSADQHIQNTPVIDLNWLDGSPESDRSSHGFGGSDQLSSATSQAESAKTGDSAVFVSDIIDNSSRIDTTGTNPPDQPAETTPPANVSKQTTPASGASNKADMSWDMYDMRYVPTPPTSAVAAERKSLAPEVSAEGQFGRKRISLAPCLKTLELGTPTGNVSDATSPLPDIDDDDDDEAFADEQAAAISPAANEAHRMKMAASLHQRVVVGEDKPVNNNTSRDSSRLPHDSPSAEDRHRIYQGRSRDGLISLLEDRDAEIADLKDYIDSLLLRVIDSCPTILQTPIGTSRNLPSRK